MNDRGTISQPASLSLTDSAPSRMLSTVIPIWVLASALLGILVGLAIGERTLVLQPVGTAYVMMVESVIYP